jgi:predicted transcriptional regulator
MKKKLTIKKSIEEKIKAIYEQYPERKEGLKDWNKGGFINDEKYKQPIKHKKK